MTFVIKYEAGAKVIARWQERTGLKDDFEVFESLSFKHPVTDMGTFFALRFLRYS